MNKRSDSSRDIFPYQAEFVERFCSSNGSECRYLLEAQPGLGSGTTVIRIIQRLVLSNSGERVLVLANSQLQQQIAWSLNEKGVPNRIVDRFFYRQLVDLSGPRSEVWPREVVCLSIDFAKQKDVLESLSSVKWSAIFVLGLPNLGQQTALALNRIIECSVSSRILLVTRKPLDGETRIRLESFTVVKWNSYDFLDSLGEKIYTARPIHFEEIDFSREQPELHLLHSIESLSRQFRERGVAGANIGSLLTRAYMSSPLSLEEVLCKLRSRIRYLDPEPVFNEFEEDTCDTSLFDRDSQNLEQIDWALDEIDDCLMQIEMLKADTKLNRLADWLGKNRSSGPLVIIASFRATVIYLLARLEELGYDVSSVYGGMPFPVQLKNVEYFRKGSGVLVSTASSLVGRELTEVDTLLFYDFPKSSDLIAQLIGQVERFRSRRPLLLSALSDELNSNNSIRKALERIKTHRE